MSSKETYKGEKGASIRKKLSLKSKQMWQDNYEKMSAIVAKNSKDSIHKISVSQKKYWESPEKRLERKAVCARVMKTQKFREACRKAQIKRCENPKEVKRLITQGIKHEQPNKKEQFLISFFKKNNLPFKYVGDGKLFIDRKCPDFVSKDNKFIIEYFGSFWHTNPKQEHRTKEGTIKHYAKHGYKTLVLTEEDLLNEEQLEEKVKELIKELK